MLDTHDQALASINEAHHTFLLRYNRNERTVYGIVEGKEDPMFYRSVVERFLPDNWKVDLIPAGNRSKTIELANILDWRSFSRLQIVFFVDRDLSAFGVVESPEGENIYVTDNYSIENSIVTPEVFGRLLLEAYNVVDLTREESETITAAFEGGLRAFKEAMTPLMAQILGWRRDKHRANLNNLNMAPMFKYADGKFCIEASFLDSEARVDHLAACVGARRYTIDELSELSATFCAAGGPASYVRGKYLIWFLATFLTHIHACIDTFVAAYKKPPKVKLPVGAANIMVIAAPRARIPASLRAFIDRTFLAYIAGTVV
jgi:hypothetical protein